MSSFLLKYSKNDDRIRHISIGHVGFSKAMNQAISSIEGKYLYVMKPSTNLKFRGVLPTIDSFANSIYIKYID